MNILPKISQADKSSVSETSLEQRRDGFVGSLGSAFSPDAQARCTSPHDSNGGG